MPWTLDFSATDHILRVKCEGPFSAEDLVPMTKASIDKLREEHALRVLLDFSTAVAQVSIAELYTLPETYVNLRAPRLAHLAMVTPADGYRMDVYQFYEDVCVNRGYFVRLFKDAAAARTWLLET